CRQISCLGAHVRMEPPTKSRLAGGRMWGPGSRLLATSEDCPNCCVNVRRIPARPIPAPSISALQLRSCSPPASHDCALDFAVVQWIGGECRRPRPCPAEADHEDGFCATHAAVPEDLRRILTVLAGL